MCGIVGMLHPEQDGPDPAMAMAAVASLHHRGPDAGGTWQDVVAGIWLGHRRLAVIGLGAGGAQPMHSRCGRYVLSYNGEIYNYRELAAALGEDPDDGGDTRVLLESLARRGIEDTLVSANGMFAFALWDRERRELVLARDRAGEKPLYYGRFGRRLVFGSQPRALIALLDSTPSIDRAALASYFRYAYVPEPTSIFEGVAKLPPGTWLRCGGDARLVTSKPKVYWSLDTVAGMRPTSGPGDETRQEALHDALRAAVARRMIADVPLGAFLSGGIDSSLMVALMQAESDRPVKTFSIGFDDIEYDESPYATAVARHLGTVHHNTLVTAADALAVVPEMAAIYDEPFADSSQIPMRLVADVARSDVVCAISGDGGDELFGGYVRHTAGLASWQTLQRLPGPLRRSLRAMVHAISPRGWDRGLRRLRSVIPARQAYASPGDRLYKLAAIAEAKDVSAMYRRLTSVCEHPERLLVDGMHDGALENLPGFAEADPMSGMMYADFTGYLPGDILVKVDRAAMAVSLETRLPFMDPAVIEAAWQLPADMLVRAGSGKWILRELLTRYLPRALVERPKMGFGVPLDSWLRGPLRDWAGDLLDPARLRRGGLLDASTVATLWREHQSGRRNRQHELWTVLMFEAWREHWTLSARP